MSNLRGLPMAGSAPAIKTLTAFYTVKKGQALAGEVLFFNENSPKNSDKLPTDGREFNIVGISAFHNIRFAGANEFMQAQRRLAYENGTRFRLEVGEEMVIDCLLADLLKYESISQDDGSVVRDVKQMGGMKLDPNQPRFIRPGLRTVFQFIQPAYTTLDVADSTVGIPNIVKEDEYYLQLNIDTDASSS
jgi:hypothetical protein